MSILFGADGELIDYSGGSGLSGLNAATILLWIYPTDDTARQLICQHMGLDEYQIQFRADLAGDPFEGYRQRDGGYITITAPAANYAAYGLNKWLYLALVFDINAIAGAQNLYMGDLTRLAAAPSSYTIQSAGSGTAQTSTAAFRIGNGSVSTREFKGRIALVAVHNKALSLAEIQEQQFHPHRMSCCGLLAYPGSSGLKIHKDYSGRKNHGVITGSSLAAGMPLRLRPPYSRRAIGKAPAAAYNPGTTGFPWPPTQEPYLSRPEVIAY